MRKSKKEDKNRQEEVQYIDISKPEFEFKPDDVLRGHDWRQQGPYLVCDSCPLKHAMYIGMNKQLTGFDDEGNPILEDR